MCVGEYIVTILVATQDVYVNILSPFLLLPKMSLIWYKNFHCGEVQEVILHTSKIVGFFLVRL